MSSNYRHIFAQRTKTFVQIIEKFELTNFELSDGFCKDLMANAYGTKQFVQISESSNYRVFELTVFELTVRATNFEILTCKVVMVTIGFQL